MVLAGVHMAAAAEDHAVEALVGAMLGPTPVIDDARKLTDGIGGRPVGSDANRAAVAWAEETLRAVGVTVRREAFAVPDLWLPGSVEVALAGDLAFRPHAVAKPFSVAVQGLAAPVVDGGFGTRADFARLGPAARGAWVLIETPVLDDHVGLAGLFREYDEAPGIESRAVAAGVAGMIFMSSRPKNLLFRHNASMGAKNPLPLVVMEREHARRILRTLRAGGRVSAAISIRTRTGGAFEAENVIAEIPGTATPEEVVLVGAHLDSHDLGTGALDNGANVVMLIDMLRQMHRLGLQPRRTIRIALFNAEEAGLYGSWGYVRRHRDELDRHRLAASIDIGTGAITGFYTGGRPDLKAAVDRLLEPVAGLGPLTQIDAPLVGTDNFDFMMEGVPNLVANQADANYASNYHAESDTFDKIDQRQLKLNGAIVAALVWRFANADLDLARQSRAGVEALIAATDLEQQMRAFNVWDEWAAGRRGRQP
ncbi:MAG: M28 family metallopeptidase [Rhodothalassiaceae bacterium]